MEWARVWAEAKSKEKAEIARIIAEDRERAREEVKARVREKDNAVQRAASEASIKIRSKAEAKRAKRERGHRLRQGPKVSLKSRKRRRRRGRQGRQGRMWRLRLRRGKENGPGPKKERRHRFPGLLTSIGRRPSSSRWKGRVW